MDREFDKRLRQSAPGRNAIIALDLDDVIANLRESLYRVLHHATGIDRHWRDWQHYDLCQHFDIAKSTLERILIRDQALERCQPEPGAAAATLALAELGFELVIITARAWHPRAEGLTRDWLTAHAVHFDRLAVVPLGGDKLGALPEGPVALAVDDHPHNIHGYQSAGIATLMINRPWNTRHQAPRAESLTAAVKHVQNLVATGA